MTSVEIAAGGIEPVNAEDCFSSDSDIGCAQRAARDWLKAHPQARAPAATIRVAA